MRPGVLPPFTIDGVTADVGGVDNKLYSEGGGGGGKGGDGEDVPFAAPGDEDEFAEGNDDVAVVHAEEEGGSPARGVEGEGEDAGRCVRGGAVGGVVRTRKSS